MYSKSITYEVSFHLRRALEGGCLVRSQKAVGFGAEFMLSIQLLRSLVETTATSIHFSLSLSYQVLFCLSLYLHCQNFFLHLNLQEYKSQSLVQDTFCALSTTKGCILVLIYILQRYIKCLHFHSTASVIIFCTPKCTIFVLFFLTVQVHFYILSVRAVQTQFSHF